LRQTAAALAADAMTPPPEEETPDDLVQRFALLPIRVMCRLLGVPDADVTTFAAWLDDLARVFVMMSPDQITAATQAILELLAYIDDLAESRRNHPGSDLITALLAAEDDGERLTHDEVVAMVANLLVAGQDTTTSQLGCSLFVLLADQRGAACARSEPSLLGSVVSETIRLEPAIPVLPRTTTESLRIGAYETPAGSVLMLCSATANRDPATWKDPDRFDPGRFENAGAPPLLTFGAGPHYCLGAALARVTLEECLRLVLTNDDWYELAEPPTDIPWRTAVGRSPARLLVTPVHDMAATFNERGDPR
jgi:cytochrome P450